jgi:hypothetical protein
MYGEQKTTGAIQSTDEFIEQPLIIFGMIQG